MKLFICGLIIILSALAGFMKAKTYTYRVTHLKQFSNMLKLLETEMTYGKHFLADIFQHISSDSLGYAGKLVGDLCKKLSEYSSRPFRNMWEESCNEVYANTSVSKEDLKIFIEIGSELGKSDIENQKSMFKRAEKQLEYQISQALEDVTTKGKMYKSIGIGVGILISILLI